MNLRKWIFHVQGRLFCLVLTLSLLAAIAAAGAEPTAPTPTGPDSRRMGGAGPRDAQRHAIQDVSKQGAGPRRQLSNLAAAGLRPRAEPLPGPLLAARHGR